MCTLSFIPDDDGYLVAMNRDELLTRGIARPPESRTVGNLQIICPTDISGGTWIAVNSAGTTWALLNWNIRTNASKERSRGEVVVELAPLSRPSEASTLISPGDLRGIDPFRVVGISALDREVIEWRWNGVRLQQVTYEWVRNHWFSSGRSDELAAQMRAQAFATAEHESGAGSKEWLRRVHSSHKPERGAFSVCVHRNDAATVSFTEVQVSLEHVRMLYRPGCPCEAATSLEQSATRSNPGFEELYRKRQSHSTHPTR